MYTEIVLKNNKQKDAMRRGTIKYELMKCEGNLCLLVQRVTMMTSV